MPVSDDYFDPLFDYWKVHCEHIIPSSATWLGRAPQDTSGYFAVIFPLAAQEPIEDTGDTFIEVIPFEIHIHGPDDKVVRLAKKINTALTGGDAPPITETTLELQRVSRRYIREDTPLHHYVLRYEWTRQFSDAANEAEAA